jgi:hypothetical protein
VGGINNASDPDGHITEAFLRDSTREDQRRGMKLRADLGEAQLQIQSQASRGEGNPLREEHPDRNPPGPTGLGPLGRIGGPPAQNLNFS